VYDNVGDTCVDGKFDISLCSEYVSGFAERYDFRPAIFDDPEEPKYPL
jgi:hypothetical protein